MSKILFVSDIHFGVPGRLQDILWAVRVAREYAHRNGIDTIISLGDLFHDRTALEIDVLCSVYDFFSETKKDYGQKWITYPGNHDMYLKHSWKVNSLKPFQDLITIIDTVKILMIDGVRFWILPFIHFESAYMRVLKKIYERHQDGDVLLTHIGTVGAVKNVCFLLKEWSAVSFHDSPFTQVYAGHFHAPQQVGRNVWYPGSLIPFKFDEGDCQHGFLVYDLEKRTHEFVDIWEVGAKYFPDETPPPNYLTIAEEIIDEIPPSVASNNILRVAVSKYYTPNERRDIEDKLSGLGAKTIKWLDVSSEEEYDKMREKMSAADHEDMFESWLKVDEKNTAQLNTGLLRQLNSDIVKRADEIYNYESEDD